MKKEIVVRAALMAALTLGLTLSCAKETPAPEEKPIDNKEQTNPSVINAGIPDEITKVALADKGVGSGMALAWEDGDALRVIATAGGSGNEEFDIEAGYTPQSAKFSGNPVAGTEFTVFYPGTYADVDAINARSYTDQVQIGNANTDHLEWNAIETGLANYSSVTFSNKQNGALRFKLQLPSDFTKVYKVALKAPSAIFYKTNDSAEGDNLTDELVLTLKADGSTNGITLGDDKVLTAYIMVSWNNTFIAEGTKLTIEVWGDQEDPWVKEKTVGTGGFTISGGKVTNVQLNNTNWDEPLFWGGSGTSDDPYQIKTVKHLKNMSSKIKSTAGASKLYFILVDDIDMSGVTDWSYANSSGGNNWPIDFNGDDHTIANFSMTQWSASLFGGLKGEVHDVTFTDAVIATNTETPSRGGLLAFRAGGTDTPAYIHDVTVNGLTVTGTTLAVGGLVGGLECGTIENCTITGLVMNAGAACGGIAGEMYTAASTITGCSVSGTITSTGESVGGIVGIPFSGSTFSGCSFNGSVTGLATVGGLIGGIFDNRSYTVSNCHTQGSVEATGKVDHSGEASWVGGLIGIARDNTQVEGIVITNSWSSANVTGNGGVVGGLCGEGIGVRIGSKSGSDVGVADACEYKNGTISGGSGSNEFRSTAGMIALPRGSYQCKIYGAKVTSATITAAAHAGGIVGQNRKMNLEIEGCLVDESYISTTGSYVGGIMAYAYSAPAAIKNNIVSDTAITGAGYVGGVVGDTAASSLPISGCSVSGATISSSSGDWVGGILGGFDGGSSNNDTKSVSITLSTVTGSITTSGNNVGGIIGGCSDSGNNKSVTITSCSSSADLGGRQNIGGIIGRGKYPTSITSCKTSGTFTSTKATDNTYVGGIGGNMGQCTITQCSSSAVLVCKKMNGGIIGAVDYANAEVSECYFSGSITANGTQNGGLVGTVFANRTLTIGNCCTSGSLSVTGGAWSGAFVGILEGGSTLNVSNCYSTMSVKQSSQGSNAQGGLFGGGNAATCVWNVSKCLAWNTKIDFSALKDTVTDGVILGMVHNGASEASTSIGNCWYRSDMDYTVGYEGRTLRSDADIDSGGKKSYDGKPYDGTCQAKAIELSWDSTKWKLDNADGYPTLKNVAE